MKLHWDAKVLTLASQLVDIYNANCKLSQLLCKTTNGITTKYVYGLGLIGEEKYGEFKTYHFDYRGSTVALTNSHGEITDTFTYDTYGKLISRTGPSFVIFGYNGRDGVVTDKNGLLYMRARYYSLELRRFINADIVAGSLENSITLNRFAYANGNPVSFIDPFGLGAERGARELKDLNNYDVAGILSEVLPETLSLAGQCFSYTEGREWSKKDPLVGIEVYSSYATTAGDGPIDIGLIQNGITKLSSLTITAEDLVISYDGRSLGVGIETSKEWGEYTETAATITTSPNGIDIGYTVTTKLSSMSSVSFTVGVRISPSTPEKMAAIFSVVAVPVAKRVVSHGAAIASSASMTVPVRIGGVMAPNRLPGWNSIEIFGGGGGGWNYESDIVAIAR